jgi:hypothetical protein
MGQQRDRHTLVRPVPADQLMQQDAECVHVAGLGHVPAHEQLWAHVRRRALWVGVGDTSRECVINQCSARRSKRKTGGDVCSHTRD